MVLGGRTVQKMDLPSLTGEEGNSASAGSRHTGRGPGRAGEDTASGHSPLPSTRRARGRPLTPRRWSRLVHRTKPWDGTGPRRVLEGKRAPRLCRWPVPLVLLGEGSTPPPPAEEALPRQQWSLPPRPGEAGPQPAHTPGPAGMSLGCQVCLSRAATQLHDRPSQAPRPCTSPASWSHEGPQAPREPPPRVPEHLNQTSEGPGSGREGAAQQPSPNPHKGARLQLLHPKTQQALLQLPCTPRGGSFQNRT